MKKIIDPSYPVHFISASTKNLALCGSGWLQATGNEGFVTCAECQRLLTKRAPDAEEDVIQDMLDNGELLDVLRRGAE